MKYKTLIIAIVLVIVLIVMTIIGILISLNVQKSPVPERYSDLPVEETDDDIIIADTMHKVTVRNEYYLVKKCVIEFYETLNNSQKENIYNKLDKAYISYKEITIDNIELKLQNIEKIDTNNCDLHINSMYTIQKDKRIKMYLLNGIFNDDTNNKKNTFSMIVNLDLVNETFSVLLNDYVEEKIGTINQDSKIGYELKQIEKNKNNQYIYEAIDDTTYAIDLMEDFKYNLKNNTSEAYNKMEEEYRTKRFGTLENFQAYIKANSEELSSIKATQYLIDTSDGSNRFVVKDQYENIYIFKISSVLDYTVRLDTYTIEEERAKTNYESASTEKKVQMNIEKFFEMINRRDYRTSYSVLADSFKANNIKTEQEFESIAKKIFFTYNKVTYSELNELGDNTYAYKIKLTDLTKQNDGEKNIQIIMQLQENMKFIMAFSVE